MKRCISFWTLLAWGALALAQAAPAPTTQQMIEQLQQPKTRSLRNLTIEAVPAAGAASTAAAPGADAPAAAPARPSLSLLIQFDFNSARVREESQQALGNLAQALQSSELASARFAVEGHTDAKGRADYNQKLSQQRADAVRDYLVAQGVASDRLVTAGKGAAELARPDAPFSAENRRVRIVNLD